VGQFLLVLLFRLARQPRIWPERGIRRLNGVVAVLNGKRDAVRVGWTLTRPMEAVMTEAEWLACTVPNKMLDFLSGKVSDRKRRLIAVAWFRCIWHLLTDERIRKAVEVTERVAEGTAAQAEPSEARLEASAAWDTLNRPFRLAFRQTSPELEGTVQAVLFRDIVRNPYSPVVVDPPWLTPTVTNLAAAAYDQRSLPSGELDPGRLGILADALEDAGCDNADILGHLRGPGPHVRGCWVVDLLLRKE
jgi:hypothetical protein